MQHVNGALERFAVAREGARRFHADAIGSGVDPSHCFADWLFRVWQGDEAGIEKAYGPCRNVDGRHPVTKAALSESTGGVTGGYLVPTALRHDLMMDVAEEAIFRPRALVVPMASSVCELPLPDPTKGAAGVTGLLGGIQLSFKPEAATRPETEPAWRKVTLKAWELTGYALASNNLLADGGRPVDAFLRRLFARSIAFYEDYFFFQGSGVGQPMGVINSPAAYPVTRHATGKFDNPNDIGSMAAALLPSSWPRAVWATNPSVYTQLVILGGGASGVSPSWQVNQPFGAGLGTPEGNPFYGCHFVLNGRPAFVSEKLPALGTKGDVCLLDPSLYVIGDRESTEIAVSRDEPTAWKNSQSVFRIVHRIDGQPWTSATLTAADGATTISPFAVLN